MKKGVDFSPFFWIDGVENMKEEIVEFIRKTVYEYEFQGAVVGISGGIDSAVVGKLCVEALGRSKVYGLILPERDSSPETVGDAVLVCEYLGIEFAVRPITKVLRSMGVYRLEPPAMFIPRRIQENYVRKKLRELSSSDNPFIDDLESEGNEKFLKGLAYYRVKHRVRMCMLYLEAEKRNYAVVGTTNKTEETIGFYVKWGDDAVDIEPIMHLYKTQVYQLAEILGVPERILRKAPSPDLVPGITDELMFGMSYEELDRILMKQEKGENLETEVDEKVEMVRKILKATKKRKLRQLGLR